MDDHIKRVIIGESGKNANKNREQHHALACEWNRIGDRNVNKCQWVWNRFQTQHELNAEHREYHVSVTKHFQNSVSERNKHHFEIGDRLLVMVGQPDGD